MRMSIRLTMTMIGFSHHRLDWHQLGNRYSLRRKLFNFAKQIRQDTLELNGLCGFSLYVAISFLASMSWKDFVFHLIRENSFNCLKSFDVCTCYLTLSLCFNKWIHSTVRLCFIWFSFCSSIFPSRNVCRKKKKKFY